MASKAARRTFVLKVIKCVCNLSLPLLAKILFLVQDIGIGSVLLKASCAASQIKYVK